MDAQKGTSLKSILGPLSYNFLASHAGAFPALRDKKTGDVWFTLLWGQVFRVSGNKMQYCFGEEAVFEQSPFSVSVVTETNVTFCWRTGLKGMPTQAKGCSGCDCAAIEIALVDANTLHFQFWMSKPVVHADLTLVRYKKEQSFAWAIQTTMPSPYKQCLFIDHRKANSVLQSNEIVTQPFSGCASTSTNPTRHDTT